MTIEQQLADRYGLELPAPPAPGGVYSPALRTGNLLYISGQLASYNGKLLTGRLGDSLSVEEGRMAARYSILNVLANVKKELGCFDRVKQFVHLMGFVQCVPDFHDHPLVINGASELLRDIFGAKGLPTRIALGSNALPGDSATELLAVVEFFAG